MLLVARYSIALKNSLSLRVPSAHHSTVFFIHDGTSFSSAETLIDNPIPIVKITAIAIIITGFILNQKIPIANAAIKLKAEIIIPIIKQLVAAPGFSCRNAT